MRKYLKITQEDFVRLRKFRKAEKGLRNSFSAWCSCLQMAITYSFYIVCIQWTSESTLNLSFSCCPFEFRIAMRNCFMLDFSLCFSSLHHLIGLEMVAQNSPSFLACFNDKKATKNTKTSQKLISNTWKGP